MIFSKRHKESLIRKKLRFSISQITRTRLFRCIQEYNFVIWETTETGFNYEVSALERLVKNLLDEHGWKHLRLWTETKKKANNIEEFFDRCLPANILDVVELFYSLLKEYKENELLYMTEINRIFSEEKSPWRLLDGKIFKIDSEYLDEEILSATQRLLYVYGFEGALDEFEQARNHYENQRHRDALTYVNHAFESTLKKILGAKYANKKTGELIKGILNSKYIPSYLKENIKSFKELLEMPPIIRSNSGGHGSGKEKLVVPQEFAQLMLHLSGSLIHYLIKSYIANIPEKPKSNTDIEKDDFETSNLEPF